MRVTVVHSGVLVNFAFLADALVLIDQEAEAPASVVFYRRFPYARIEMFKITQPNLLSVSSPMTARQVPDSFAAAGSSRAAARQFPDSFPSDLGSEYVRGHIL